MNTQPEISFVWYHPEVRGTSSWATIETKLGTDGDGLVT